jgi:hypothetical protein
MKKNFYFVLQVVRLQNPSSGLSDPATGRGELQSSHENDELQQRKAINHRISIVCRFLWINLITFFSSRFLWWQKSTAKRTQTNVFVVFYVIFFIIRWQANFRTARELTAIIGEMSFCQLADLSTNENVLVQYF